MRAVQKYIEWSRYELTHIVVENESVESVHQTFVVLSQCFALEHLEFWGEFDYADFYELLKDLKKLRTLVTSSLVSQQYIAKFLETLPQLEQVQFFRTTHSGTKDIRWPQDLPNLKHLSFDCYDKPRVLNHAPGFHIPSAFATRDRRENYVSSSRFV